MKELCEVCNKREYSILCDHAIGTGIVTIVGFKERTVTCDTKLCRECAVNLWSDCDLCPAHAKKVLNNECLNGDLYDNANQVVKDSSMSVDNKLLVFSVLMRAKRLEKFLDE
ncbi:hypothetical protein ACFFIX_19725 [Metabacillus herbersteinensis]|uniref:RING-type domain-containing protein n=1 Tax=Metabacillus herbersteinensis TaxID=283816 RepID=A0ABV6GJD3_9BACI